MNIDLEIAKRIYETWCEKHNVRMRPYRFHALKALVALNSSETFLFDDFLKAWHSSPINSTPSAYRILGELVESGILAMRKGKSEGREVYVWEFTEKAKG